MNEFIYTILYCLSIYGLAFIIKEKDGPFNVILKLRTLLFKLNFFVELFSCYACLGAWCGAAIYLITTASFNYKILILNILGGAMISFIMDLVTEALIARTFK